MKCLATPQLLSCYLSRPARGAWIEMRTARRGARQTTSRPARGAWIEIRGKRPCYCCRAGRAPQGARGLKYSAPPINAASVSRRAPQGARGLKSVSIEGVKELYESRPARGAWIEILPSFKRFIVSTGRAPQGARGLKSKMRVYQIVPLKSRPARGAWIEMKTESPHIPERKRRAPQGARGLK